MIGFPFFSLNPFIPFLFFNVVADFVLRGGADG